MSKFADALWVVGLCIIIQQQLSLFQHTSVSALSLFPFQQHGCERLIGDKRLLLADEMGLGKTVQCIEAIRKIGNNNKDANVNVSVNVLIICPKSVLGVWENELQTWLSPTTLDFEIQLVTKDTKSFPIPPLPSPSNKSESEQHQSIVTVTLVNYDLCHKFRGSLKARKYDVLICDEAHYLKSLAAKRTEAVFGNGAEIPGIQSDYLWLLTGTPVLNRPVELFPLLRAISSEFDSFKEYTMRYCDPKTIQDRRGKFRVDYSGATNLLELSKRLEPIMLRRYKTDVLTELPDKFRGVTVLHSGAGARSERERLQDILETNTNTNVGFEYRRDGGMRSVSGGVEEFGAEASNLAKYLGVGDMDLNDPDQRNLIMGYISTIRKETALMKVDLSMELLEDVILTEKVVVFAHHREVLHQLVDKFGERAVCVMGGISTEERTEAVRKFQEDENVRIFIGSIRAAGVGLTLTASSNVIFLEMDWSPGVMAQAEDRCHRVGQLDSVRVQYFVFQDTIDEWIAQSLIKKQNNIDQILSSKTQLGPEGSTSSSAYTLEFGKYQGLRLEDTPRDFIQYLIKKEVWRKRPRLWHALHTKGLIVDKPLGDGAKYKTSESGFGGTVQTDVESRMPPNTDNVPCMEVSYRFDFGKHNGKVWNEVPRDYRDWIVKEGVWEKRANLRSALVQAGIVDGDDTNVKSSCNVSHQTQVKGSFFPIKSFRLTAQCPYIIKELEARNISVDDADKEKITRLKKKLLDWHKVMHPDATSREIQLIGCNPDLLWSVTKAKKTTDSPLRK